MNARPEILSDLDEDHCANCGGFQIAAVAGWLLSLGQ